MRTFIENYLHFMKNCIRPHYEKLKPLKSGFIDNSNFENYRDPWDPVSISRTFPEQFVLVPLGGGWLREPVKNVLVEFVR